MPRLSGPLKAMVPPDTYLHYSHRLTLSKGFQSTASDNVIIRTVKPSQLAQYALYSAAAISVASVVGHTHKGFEMVFPSLRKAGEKDKGALSAKIGWLEGNQVFAIMGN
jgi:hypothetical protein